VLPLQAKTERRERVKRRAMATSLVRSGFLRTALRGGARGSQAPKRNFSSAGHHDDACKYLIISLFSNPIYFRV